MNARMEWDETKVKASVSPEEWQTRVDLGRRVEGYESVPGRSRNGWWRRRCQARVMLVEAKGSEELMIRRSRWRCRCDDTRRSTIGSSCQDTRAATASPATRRKLSTISRTDTVMPGTLMLRV